MADYHTVYSEPEGTTTEWEDLQVKYGNAQPKPKPQVTPWAPAADKKREGGDDDDVDELEGEEDDRFMEEYRRRRIEEIKAASLQPQFGSVELIKGSDFVREVTNASHSVWVIVLLFKEGVASCALLERSLAELAKKFRGTKFVRIISTDCIPKYPDANLPTLLVYKGGTVKETFVGLLPFMMPGMAKASPEAVALALCKIGSVLAGPGESEDDVLERVRRDVLLGMVEHHTKQAAQEEDDLD